MTCASCSQRVERALLQMEEVTGAEVNLMGAKVKVTFAADTDVASLFDEVRNASGTKWGRSCPKSPRQAANLLHGSPSDSYATLSLRLFWRRR